MIRSVLVLILLVILSSSALAQTVKVPKFTQYPAAVEMVRIKSRLLRNVRINFAGHYIITGSGCGTGCTNAMVTDARDGRVIRPDQFFNIDASYGADYSDVQLDFRKNSRLLIIHGRPGTKNESARLPPSGDHYYEWRGNRLHLLKSVPKKSK